MTILTKDKEQIDIIRSASRHLAEILAVLQEHVAPGMTTADLDKLAIEEVKRRQLKAAFYNYNGFPANICISVNDEVVHGIPSVSKKIEFGDLLKLDMGVIYHDYYADSAITMPVVEEHNLETWKNEHKDKWRLIEVTRKSLELGLGQAKAGHRVGAIGHAVQNFVESAGFSVVKDLVGHGIGSQLHEPPHIPNYGQPEDGPILQSGMTLAVEPMVNIGSWQVKLDDDGWTYRTADGSLSAHFEHTILVSNDGPEILSKL